MKNKEIALIAVFAALYAAMVVVFAPFSFQAFQFRVAGVIRPAIARKRILVVAYALGVVVGNLFSPLSFFWELLFMPVMSLIAGVIGYEIAYRFNNNYYICGVVIAIIIPVSVSWMLFQLNGLPILVTLPGIFLSEQVVNILGATVFKLVDSRYRWWE